CRDERDSVGALSVTAGRELAYDVSDSWYSYDAVPALQGTSLRIKSGERLALLGPNGSGKSTLRLWCKLQSGPNVGWLCCSEWQQWVKRQVQHSRDPTESISDGPNLPVLNWPFLIFSANSIPLIVIAALSNRLNPSIGRILCFTRR